MKPINDKEIELGIFRLQQVYKEIGNLRQFVQPTHEAKELYYCLQKARTVLIRAQHLFNQQKRKVN